MPAASTESAARTRAVSTAFRSMASQVNSATWMLTLLDATCERARAIARTCGHPGAESCRRLAAADRLIAGMEKTIQQKIVTYDFARLMEGATEVRTSEFADAIIAHM